MNVYEITPDDLEEYSQIPIAFEVRSFLRVELVEQGLGGIRFVEKSVEPYIKDYDALDTPLDWVNLFDVKNWGFLLAREGNEAVGGAAVAWNTNDVNMLEGRVDLSVLWDIRVHPNRRGQGIGTVLFRNAAAWSAQNRRGCRQMKIETQNINVAACRFYARMGCELGDIRRFGYIEDPRVAHETQLNWYLNLA